MKPTQFSEMPCPVARSLGRVGDSWSMLIMRDAFHGLTRFDEFEKSLHIAPNILTRRLADLVENGMLERRQYQQRPPRYEYLLTPAGRSFRPVLLALIAWGNENFAPEGVSLQVVDRETGLAAAPVPVDANSGLPLSDERFMLAPGPMASETMRARLDAGERRARARLGLG
ncbi:MAG: helix-turn-helix domain-containing protein [Pseudomonadota bacterium]